MAAEFVILGDESKFVKHFDARVPLVIEILPEARGLVFSKLQNLFPGAGKAVRISDKKRGCGHY